MCVSHKCDNIRTTCFGPIHTQSVYQLFWMRHLVFFSIDFSRLVFICFQSFIYLSPLHLLRLFACNMKSQTQPRRIIAKSTKLIKQPNEWQQFASLFYLHSKLDPKIPKLRVSSLVRCLDLWFTDNFFCFFFGQIQMHQCNA